MWTLWLLSTALAAPPTARPGWRCGTIREEVVGLFTPTVGWRASLTGEEPPDPYGTWPHESGSEHFLVRWGDDGVSIGTTEVDELLATLERAWELFVVELGHTEPAPTDGGRFRVYLGDSWDQGPPSYDNAGYFYADPTDQPILVIADWVTEEAEQLHDTATHELYHAVQAATGAYDYEGASAWYWEATATWTPTLLYPAGDGQIGFLYAYAFHPHLPLSFFRYPSTGDLIEYYQYGAFVFPLHIGLEVDPSVIRDSWEEPDPAGDPLAALQTHLEARGHDLSELWLDHAARNVTWDYPDSARYREHIDSWSAWVGPTVDHQITDEVPADGGLGLSPRRALRPGRYGANVWRLSGLGDDLKVRITGRATGTLGSEARWGGRLVRGFDGEVLPIPFDGEVGTLDIPRLTGGEPAWLVIGAWTDVLHPSRWEEEQFDYTLDVEVVPRVVPVVPEDEEARACGCGTPTRWSGLWLLPMVLLRRRQSSRSPAPGSATGNR
jgi:hypothetical protein